MIADMEHQWRSCLNDNSRQNILSRWWLRAEYKAIIENNAQENMSYTELVYQIPMEGHLVVK
jgi:hypothetical protein